MDDEVTRIEAVRHLSGAAAHGVVSTLFLVVLVALLRVGRPGGAVMAGVCAYGVALNGLSLYLWDELRDALEATVERGDSPDRTLTAHRVSTETKLDLLAGFVTAVGLVAFLLAVLGGLRLLGPRSLGYLLVAALAVGNVVALGRVALTPNGPRGEEATSADRDRD